MVLYDLHRVWDDVPFHGKSIAAFFVILHIGAIVAWLRYLRKEVSKYKKD
jgi:hypothetical protein